MSEKHSQPPDRDLLTFRSMLSSPEGEDFPLFRAALLISSLQYPEMEEGWWRQWEERFVVMVEDAQLALGAAGGEQRVLLDQLADYFSNTLHFHGEETNFHAPENSCLTEVLERRSGLPITLSVVLVSMGRRLGLDMYGVSSPGHFLVGARTGGADYFLDPFGECKVLEKGEATHLLSHRTGLMEEQILPFLRRSQPHDILARMLRNLKVTYANKGDLPRLARTMDWLLEIEPDNLAEVCDRGLVLLRMSEPEKGARDLLRFLQETPNPDDEHLERIRQEALRALTQRDNLN